MKVTLFFFQLSSVGMPTTQARRTLVLIGALVWCGLLVHAGALLHLRPVRVCGGEGGWKCLPAAECHAGHHPGQRRTAAHHVHPVQGARAGRAASRCWNDWLSDYYSHTFLILPKLILYFFMLKMSIFRHIKIDVLILQRSFLIVFSVQAEREWAEPVAVSHQESQHLQWGHAALLSSRCSSQWQVDMLPAGGSCW